MERQLVIIEPPAGTKPPEHKAPRGAFPGRAVALVTRTSQNPNIWHTALLCHSTPEMATEHDLVLRNVLPYPLVIMGEASVHVWHSQIVRHLEAELDERYFQAITNALKTEGQSLVGVSEAQPLPLSPFWEPRRDFLEGIANQAALLSSSVHQTLI